jgi:5-methylcytosine-specific restriction endonuclease McrA
VMDVLIAPRDSARRSPTAGNFGQGSKWLRKSTRRRIYERDGHQCVWCCEKVTPKGCPEDYMMGCAATIDHVVPRSKGGTNFPSNLITSCNACNSKRGGRSVPEFAKAVWVTAHDPNTWERCALPCIRRVRAAQRRRLPRSYEQA